MFITIKRKLASQNFPEIICFAQVSHLEKSDSQFLEEYNNLLLSHDHGESFKKLEEDLGWKIEWYDEENCINLYLD